MAQAQATSSALVEPPTGLKWSSQEVQRQALPQLHATHAMAQSRGLLGCDIRCGQIVRVWGRLLDAVRAQGARGAALPWQLIVVRLDREEAFALPEGQVVLSERFVHEQALGDAMLAFVLAHEMAHSLLEHERQTLTYALALLPRDVPRSVADVYTEMAHNLGFLRLLQPISQQVELEADELGLLLAAAAGYEPDAQLDFMRAEAARAPLGRPVLATHPPAALRLQRLQQRLPLAQRVWQQGLTAAPD